MKTVLRIISKNSNWHDITNPYKMIPSKGDHVVWDKNQYTVSYLEFDYDEDVLYIVCLN